MYKPDCNQLPLYLIYGFIPTACLVSRRVGVVGLPYALLTELLTIIDLRSVVSTLVNWHCT